MGWYIRKAFSAGPVKFNLSKSGMGLSFGVKGARMGVGPRGMYTHFGRGGLYYRSSYGGSSRISLQPKSYASHQDYSPSEGDGVLFDDKQINYRKLVLDITFKRSRKREAIYLAIGILSFMISGSPEISKSIATLFSVLGIFMFLAILFHNIKAYFLKLKSEGLYKKLKECYKLEEGTLKTDIEKLKGIIEKYEVSLDEGYLKRASYLFYKDYLSAVVNDFSISPQEKEELQRIEELLNLDKDLIFKIKRWAFNRVYLGIVEDKVLSEQEEKEIFRIQSIFSLSDNDISEELETLNTLKEARKIGGGSLTPISVNVSLNKEEECYHKTKGRIVKEKILRSYQSDGVRHNVRGMVTEKDGELYLTSKRIIIVGEGVYDLKLEKIFNIETDIDDNMVTMDVDGRKSSIVLTMPDSLIFSAKLSKLKQTLV